MSRELICLWFLVFIQKVQSEDDKLKHLDFVEDAMQEAVGIASSVYDYVKDKVGAIPGVETIETTVKNVVGPAIEKFQDVPGEVLKFVDRKVSFSSSFLYSL